MSTELEEELNLAEIIEKYGSSLGFKKEIRFGLEEYVIILKLIKINLGGDKLSLTYRLEILNKSELNG